jgi:hypothetical protein
MKEDKIRPKSFNTIVLDFNSNKFVPYDVMPYLVNEYDCAENKPSTFDEFKEFVQRNSMYQFWGRCEYEVVLHDWPCDKTEKKIDVHEQIMMNIDTVVDLFVQNIKLK